MSKKPVEIALLMKEGCSGMTRREVVSLIGMFAEHAEVYPIEICAKEHECSAMGFISDKAAGMLEYDYDSSHLNDFIAVILDDAAREHADNMYDFNGIPIWMGYETVEIGHLSH